MPRRAAAPPRDLDSLLDELRARGSRVTTARRAVLGALVDAGAEHTIAEELAARVQAAHPDIHLSTIYRTLEMLEAIGLVTHVHLGHGPSTYHLDANVHHHAVCERCGAVIELPMAMLESVDRRLRRDYGFLLAHHFALVGRCAACHDR